MADLSQQMKCVLHINHPRAGWMETYYLKTNSYPLALDAAKLLVHYRRSFIAEGCKIVWARVSFLGRPRERQGLEGLPLGPLPQHPQGVPVDNPNDALHYAFETQTGRWGNRLLRGIADDLVADFIYNGVMPEPLPPAQALSSPLDGGASLNRIRQSFLRWLVNNTMCVRIQEAGPPTLGDAVDWQRVFPRRVTTRRSGRPFGLHRGRAHSKIQAQA